VGSTDIPISYLSTRLEEVDCSVVVHRPLPSCEHSASMACSADPSQIPCTEACDVERPCCSKPCPARCGECKELSTKPRPFPQSDRITRANHVLQSGKITRVNHVSHSCSKDLDCRHTCKQLCAVGHVCGECTSECRQSCDHHRCELGCPMPCTPCAEPCSWSCPHQICPVPCGSVSPLRQFQFSAP